MSLTNTVTYSFYLICFIVLIIWIIKKNDIEYDDHETKQKEKLELKRKEKNDKH